MGDKILVLKYWIYKGFNWLFRLNGYYVWYGVEYPKVDGFRCFYDSSDAINFGHKQGWHRINGRYMYSFKR